MTNPEEVLLGWIDKPRADTGVHFSVGRDGWDYWSYERLAARASEIAAGIQQLGVEPGSAVLVTARSGPEFIGSFYGTLLAGCVAAPLAPPLIFGSEGAYLTHLERLVEVAQPRVLLSEGPVSAPVARLASRAPALRTVIDVFDFEAGRQPEPVSREELALLQFTSGSMSTPRGVRVPYASLAANVQAIAEWLEAENFATSAHWLPFYHDMGLIGGLITPVTTQTTLWNLQPEQFVRSPLSYLELFGRTGAHVGTMPNFGLQHVLRRVRPEQLEGCDFSAMGALILGAERLHPQVLDDFARLLAPFGFREEVLAPAYGLAEATLAVTGASLRNKLVYAVPAVPEAVPVVGCGQPLPGMSVEVLDDDAKPLPDGEVGRIAVTGPAVADGYQNSDGVGSAEFVDGRLLTGDAGFMRDGELFVIGRLGDSLKVRGLSVFAEDLEVELGALPQVGNAVVVLLGSGSGSRPTAVAVFRRPDAVAARAAAALLAARTEGADVHVVATGDDPILRTTSGKPKRREMWRRFVEGGYREITLDESE